MSLLTPNTDSIDSYYDKGKFTLAWRLCLLFGFVFLFLTITFITSTVEEIVTYATCTLISVGSVFYLAKTKSYKPVYYFLAITGTLIASYTLMTFNTLVHYGDFLWIILIVIFAFFGLGVRVGIFFLLVNLGTITYYCLFEVNANITAMVPLSDSAVVSLAIELVAATLSISYVTYQFVMFHNYSYKNLLEANKELQGRNEVISNQNNENRTLLKEIHHRVKNNLQIIVSLLRMQSVEMKSAESKKHFSEAINRIMAMSLIHQKLYGGEELSKLDLKSYINDLVHDIISVSLQNENVEFIINVDNTDLSLDTIVPLGLLINELVSNSLKHAFSEEKGEIEIKIEHHENEFTFYYSDNGNWIEPSTDKISFGVELIDILTEQMNGTKELNNKNGANYTFHLKNL